MAKQTKNHDKQENRTTQGNESNNLNEEVSLHWVGVRLLYTLLFMLIFSITETIIQLTLVFQFVHLFFMRKQNEQVRAFSNKASTYAYKVLRYVTMNEDQRPFPFTDWPKALEPPGDSK